MIAYAQMLRTRLAAKSARIVARKVELPPSHAPIAAARKRSPAERRRRPSRGRLGHPLLRPARFALAAATAVDARSQSQVEEWIWGSFIQSHWPWRMLWPISRFSRIFAIDSAVVPAIQAGR